MSDMHYPISNLFTEHQQSAVKRARELWDLFEPHHIMERSMMMSELYVIISRLLGEVAVRDSKLTVRDNELAEKRVEGDLHDVAIATRDSFIAEQYKQIHALKETVLHREDELAEKQVDLEIAISERDAAVKQHEEQQKRLDEIKAGVDADIAGMAPWRDYEDAYRWFVTNIPQLTSPRAPDSDPIAAVTVPGEMLRAIFIQNSMLHHANFNATYAQRAISRLNVQAYDELDAVKKKLATARAILYHVFLHGNGDKHCKYCQDVDQLIPDTKEAYERSEFERE